MRQFRPPSLSFSLRTYRREVVGNATKISLKDCIIMIPTSWIRVYKKDGKTDVHYIQLSEYWASTIYRKILDAGGNPKKYKSLMSINF